MLQGFKPPMSATSQDMADELARLSKSALIDVYCQALAAQLDGHGNARGVGVDGVLDEFLHHARRAFDHFASRNLVDDAG